MYIIPKNSLGTSYKPVQCTGARLQKLARARATSPCLARSAVFLIGRVRFYVLLETYCVHQTSIYRNWYVYVIFYIWILGIMGLYRLFYIINLIIFNFPHFTNANVARFEFWSFYFLGYEYNFVIEISWVDGHPQWLRTGWLSGLSEHLS